jgi:hypothetical protein
MGFWGPAQETHSFQPQSTELGLHHSPAALLETCAGVGLW